MITYIHMKAEKAFSEDQGSITSKIVLQGQATCHPYKKLLKEQNEILC